jgi:hypothetical protein
MPRKIPKVPETNCETCAYWLRDDSDKGMTSATGECHKNPPTVFYDPDLGLGSAWPPTDDVDRCGQWYARLNA